jgi:hypothetical protein
MISDDTPQLDSITRATVAPIQRQGREKVEVAIVIIQSVKMKVNEF